MASWKELKEFEHIDLQDSYVTGWKNSGETFSIEMELSLWPGHEDYDAPNKDEHTCYKKGRLIFREPRNIRGLRSMEDVTPNKVLPNEIPDYDTIDDFQVDDLNFRVAGAFGEVTLSATAWEIKIATKST